MKVRVLAAFAVLALVTACGTGELPQTPQPRDGRAGLQLSGTVAGSQVAVSDGSPDLTVGDCAVVGGAAVDLCVASRDLRGGPVVLTVRNPAALVEGVTVPVEDSDCDGPACDAVTDVAIVDVALGDAVRRRAVGGRLEITVADEGARYAGSLHLDLVDGDLSGHFDLVPRPR